MQIRVGNFRLEKADEDDKTLKVRCIANTLQSDRQDETILPKAFNKSTVDNFIKHGIIDWFHESVKGASQLDRAQAVIGQPERFEWEGGLPVVYASLSKSNPIVRDSILPNIEAGLNVYGASVGGSVLKASRKKDSMGMEKNYIEEIEWNHLAIAPSSYVVSPGSAVTITKASNGDETTILSFNDVSSLSFELDELPGLSKALTANIGTDSATAEGFGALVGESLEGDGKGSRELGYDWDEYIVKSMESDVIGGSIEGVQLLLRDKGLTPEDAKSYSIDFEKRISEIL